jgi:hypothetical protein
MTTRRLANAGYTLGFQARGRIPMTTSPVHWSDLEEAARQMAGNWQEFDSFAWSRGYRLEDAEQWMIGYTSHRDSGLLDQSNAKAITERLAPFSVDDDPDLVFERHCHFAVGHIDGLSIRVYRADGSITAAFREFCRIQERLDDYPILDAQDYEQREYEATLANYRIEMWQMKDQLPQGWEGEVYSWFGDHGQDRYTENHDDRGGYAPREAILAALHDLGLLPNVIVEN